MRHPLAVARARQLARLPSGDIGEREQEHDSQRRVRSASSPARSAVSSTDVPEALSGGHPIVQLPHVRDSSLGDVVPPRVLVVRVQKVPQVDLRRLAPHLRHRASGHLRRVMLVDIFGEAVRHAGERERASLGSRPPRRIGGSRPRAPQSARRRTPVAFGPVPIELQSTCRSVLPQFTATSSTSSRRAA